MKRSIGLASVLAWLSIAVAIGLSPRVGAKELPVDEQRIVDEMEALADRTPEPDAKTLKKVNALLDKGVKAHDKKNYTKAIEIYNQALELYPVAAGVHYELSYTYSRMGETAKALEYAIRALALDPKVELYHIVKANLLDDLGLRDEAVAAFESFLEIQPKSYLGHVNLAITHARMGNYEAAEKGLLTAIELDPQIPSAHFHLATIYQALGYNYDEQSALDRFLEVGKDDPRRGAAEDRLKELQGSNINVDMGHPYPMIELMDGMTRVLWRTKTHRERFPDARGYTLTFDEDKEVYASLLGEWRGVKDENPEAAHGFYDLLLQIDDAGYLDEYIWYSRQDQLGGEARTWVAENRERIDAFVTWAQAAGVMSDGDDDEGGTATRLDTFRELPGEIIRAIEESKLLYEIGAELPPEAEIATAERERFRKSYRADGDDRIVCGGVERNLDEAIAKLGSDALIPALRCFIPGSEGHALASQRASVMGLQVVELELNPQARLQTGDSIQLASDNATWLFWAMAKAAWQNEPAIREEYGGVADGTQPSLVEEFYAAAAMIGAYVNSREVEDAEDPPASIPEFERLVSTVHEELFRGFVLYELVHKTYGVPLDRLDERHAQAVKGYLLRHVLHRVGS